MADSFKVDKKKILKNTLYLYFRMVLTVCINFYVIRLLLVCLGVEDYGLYNLLFGFVTIFALLNNALSSMTQRYICYELGRNKLENARKNFTISCILFGAGLIIFILLAETIGLWFVCNKLQIPEARFDAAKITYQMSILCFAGRIVQTPFIAIITAYERMSVFAMISIFEMLGLLVFVLCLEHLPGDKLILFTIYYTLIVFLISGFYTWYCFRNLPVCRIVLNFTRKRIGVMSSFFSWSILGASANLTRNQGLNILLNVFFSVTMNASWAISQKIGAAVNQIVGNFQLAFNPQILKSYTLPDKKEFYDLLISTSRYSFLILWLIALPLVLETEFFLDLWLGNTLPPYSVLFTRITIVVVLVHAISGPLWTAAMADGKVAQYQFCISCLIASSFFLSWILLAFGLPAYWVPVSMVIADVVCLMYRLIYLKYRFGLPFWGYMRFAMFPMLGVTLFSTAIAILLQCQIFGNGLIAKVGLLFATEIFSCIAIVFLGLRKMEQKKLFAKIQSVIPKKAIS